MRHHVRARFALLALTAGFTACTQPLGPDQAQAVAISRFGLPNHSLTAFSGYTEPQRFVVHDQTTLAFVWKTVYQTYSTPPDVPLVDFSKNAVVMVALGARPTSGYEVLLDSAIHDSHGLTVQFHEVAPQGIALQVVTYPLDAGIVPWSEGPIEFQDLTK